MIQNFHNTILPAGDGWNDFFERMKNDVVIEVFYVFFILLNPYLSVVGQVNPKGF